MRKNLLASAAVLGGLLFTGGAMAQVVSTTGLSAGAGAPNGSSSFPSPGTVTIRLGGLLDWYAVGVSDSGDKTTPVNGAGATVAKYKQANYTFGDYIRLFPTVDGVAANGLRYGVYSEFRIENFIGAGGGSVGGVSGQDRTTSLYVRRAYGYFGLANAGYIRLGTGDGVNSLFDTGTFQDFDQGGWNGDIPSLISGNAQVVFPFQGGVGAFYATNKLTYLSPQLYGLEVGVSYEPNTSNVGDYDSGTIASPSAYRLSSSSTAGDLSRRRNAINPGVRYRNTFGPIGVALEAAYMHSGSVSYDGVATSATKGYKGWDYGTYGAVLTFGGFSAGGQIMQGAFNGQGALKPQGTPNALAFIFGAEYTVGPIIAGVQVFRYDFAGNSGSTPALVNVGQERDRGIAAGATYTIIPGVSGFLSYVWGDKRESGYDLLNSVVSTNGSTVGNKTRAEAVAVGMQIRW